MAHYRDHHDPYYVSTAEPRTKPPSYYTSSRACGHSTHPPSPTYASGSTSTPSLGIPSRPSTYSRAPPPSNANSGISVDPLLAFHPRIYNMAIEYDLSLPPSNILQRSRSSHETPLSRRERAIPATYPPLPFLRLQCNLLPWPIDVYPVDHSTVVTVGDVLEGIYHELRQHVSGSEWHGAAADTREHVRRSWLRRCKREQTQDNLKDNSSNGLRRVDWLSKHTVFQGLSPGQSRGHMVLHLSQKEKTVKFCAGS